MQQVDNKEVFKDSKIGIEFALPEIHQGAGLRSSTHFQVRESLPSST